MKKLLLGILLGFFLHKGLVTYHSYAWWTAEASEECRNEIVREFAQISVCVDKQMPISKFLPYVIVTPQYIFKKWKLRY